LYNDSEIQRHLKSAAGVAALIAGGTFVAVAVFNLLSFYIGAYI
jgi:hypothetical protein